MPTALLPPPLAASQRFKAISSTLSPKSRSFSFLYLNPPYDSEIGSMNNKRMEFLFLQHTYRWLVEGGGSAVDGGTPVAPRFVNSALS